jgi:hypothetical protein
MVIAAQTDLTDMNGRLGYMALLDVLGFSAMIAGGQ